MRQTSLMTTTTTKKLTHAGRWTYMTSSSGPIQTWNERGHHPLHFPQWKHVHLSGRARKPTPFTGGMKASHWLLNTQMTFSVDALGLQVQNLSEERAGDAAQSQPALALQPLQ